MLGEENVRNCSTAKTVRGMHQERDAGGSRGESRALYWLQTHNALLTWLRWIADARQGAVRLIMTPSVRAIAPPNSSSTPPTFCLSQLYNLLYSYTRTACVR